MSESSGKRARVKICGLTRPEDAGRAADLGAWACGMILSNKGPRFLDLARAHAVRKAIPEGVLAVGVFVNEPPQKVDDVALALGLDFVQLHGEERPETVASLKARVLKSVGMPARASTAPDPFAAGASLDLARFAVGVYPAAWGFLFDAFDGETGGTGKTFPWEILTDAQLRAAVPEGRLVLAGGLTPENVALALETVRPYAVDVSSGVESAPGIKDRDKLARFFAAVHDWEDAA